MYLEDRIENASSLLLPNWVNGNLYERATEVTGVLPIPEDVRTSAGMAPYEAALDAKRLHHHLASLQGTRKAVTPIHNDIEKTLFRDLMAAFPETFGNLSSDNQAAKAAKIWNGRAETEKDLPEHLKVYYNGPWKTNSNIIQTKAVSAAVRKPLLETIHDEERMRMAPTVPQTTLKPHSVLDGLLSFDPETQDPAAVTSESQPLPTTSSAVQPDMSSGNQSMSTGNESMSHPPASETPNPPTPIAGPSQTHDERIRGVAKRRVEDALSEREPPVKKARRGRTCCKCGISECPGKGSRGVKSCRNKCRDCGNVECAGRDTQSRAKTCSSMLSRDE
ncbi:unnamed protein product [Mycena citricolor]|uniref:Uncharacterized protein n=1 Tax=Mycena citricolor TaxID=2018698 RepID=A0AAD2K8G9_9AGAR|nr:unnamed protein product [Mycena citricolor]